MNPNLRVTEKYATFKNRLPRRSELTEVFDKILSKKSTGEWLKIFAKKIPAAPVCTPRQAILEYCATNPDKTMTLKLSSYGGEFYFTKHSDSNERKRKRSTMSTIRSKYRRDSAKCRIFRS